MKKLSVHPGTLAIIIFLLSMSSPLIFSPLAHSDVLTVPAGLKLVTEKNRLVKIADYEEMGSVADTLIAKAKTLPDINATGGHTSLAHPTAAQFGTQEVPLSEQEFFFFSLSVQQTLYDFRKNASRYEESKKLLNAKKLDAMRTRNLVAIDFVLVYLDLLESEHLVEVDEKEVEMLESHLRNAQNLYEEGVITKNDLLQARVKISDAQQRLLTARNLRAVTASRLNSILVRPLTADVQVEDISEVSPQFLETDRETAWQIAEKQRPEILIVEETMQALDLERTAIKSDYYPKLFVKGGYDYTENRFQVPQGNWSVTLGMGINLFEGGRTRAELLKIDSQRMRLAEERNKLVDDVRLEVEKYLLAAETARDRVAVTKDAVEQAEENLRINRVKYGEGAGTATDVLDAVTLLTVAETNHYKSVYDLKKAEAAVLYATGTELSEVYK